MDMRKNYLLVLGIMFCWLTVGFRAEAQEHPRLYFTPADIPNLKNIVNDTTVDENGVSFNALWKHIQARADYWVTQTLPAAPLAPADYNLPFPMLNYLSFAYVITEELAYLNKAKATLLKVSDWPDWGASISFFQPSAITSGVAMAYDLIYDRLTENERSTVRTSLINLGINPAQAMTYPSICNDNLIPCSAYGCGALVIKGEDPSADALIAGAKQDMKNILDDGYNWSPDGGYPEGLGYGTVGFDGDGIDGAILFIDALKRVTGDDSLLQHAYMKGLLNFALYTMSPDGKYGTGISDTWGYPGFQLTALRLAGELQDVQQNYAKWFLKKTGYLNPGSLHQGIDFPGINTVIGLLYYYYARNVNSRSPQAELPTSQRFRGMDWITLRNSWDDPEGILLSLKCGPGYYHENNDANAFQIFAYGAEVATDQGYGHTWFASGTYGHNSILVDDEGQVAGWVNGRYGSILKFIGSEAFDYNLGDASLVYGESSPYLEKWQRHIIFAKPNYFIVFDDLVSKNNIFRKFSCLLQIVHIHSIAQQGEFVISEDAVISRPTNNSTTGQLYSKIILPSADFTVDAKMYTDHSENYGPYCEIHPNTNAAATKFLLVLYPQPNGAAAPEITGFDVSGGKGIAVNEADARNLHLINFGTGIISGENLETDGFTAQLSMDLDGVTPITYVVIDGTTLKYQGRTLLAAEKPSRMIFSRWSHYEKIGSTPYREIVPSRLTGKIQCDATKVSFFCEVPMENIYVDGNKTDCEWDPATQMVSLTLSAGEHEISINEAGSVSPEEAIKSVSVYPNPYIQGKSSDQKITFDKLPKQSTLRIYAISGELITEIKHQTMVDGGKEEWDISGIASGIYIYYIEASKGNKKGKVSIIK